MNNKTLKIVKQCLGISIQVGGLLSLFVTPWSSIPLSFYLFISFYFLIGLFGFSAGWHRGLAHRSFECSDWVKWAFFCMGSMNFLGSLVEFLAEHPYHHSALNTKYDPTHRSAGWWYSHIGWVGRYEVDRMRVEKIVSSSKMYQKMQKIGIPVVIFFSWVFPVAVAMILSLNFYEALLLAGCLRLALVHNFLGFTGSYCHSVKGESINSHWVAFLTLGEGYQENHHKFPKDYRSGLKSTDLDFSKWALWLLSKMKIISNLRKEVP